MKEVLPFLFILICPLMMIFMMRGMHGGGHRQAGDTHEMNTAELRRLHDEIDGRLQALDERVRDVEASTDARYDDALRS